MGHMTLEAPQGPLILETSAQLLVTTKLVAIQPFNSAEQAFIAAKAKLWGDKLQHRETVLAEMETQEDTTKKYLNDQETQIKSAHNMTYWWRACQVLTNYQPGYKPMVDKLEETINAAVQLE